MLPLVGVKPGQRGPPLIRCQNLQITRLNLYEGIMISMALNEEAIKCIVVFKGFQNTRVLICFSF